MPTPIDADEDEAHLPPYRITLFGYRQRVGISHFDSECFEQQSRGVTIEVSQCFLREASNKPHAIEVEDNKTEFLLKDFVPRAAFVFPAKRTSGDWRCLLLSVQ